MMGIVADKFLTGKDFWPQLGPGFLAIIDVRAGGVVLDRKQESYVWFYRHAGADHHFRDRSDPFWAAGSAWRGPFGGARPSRSQKGPQRSEKPGPKRRPAPKSSARRLKSERRQPPSRSPPRPPIRRRTQAPRRTWTVRSSSARSTTARSCRK